METIKSVGNNTFILLVGKEDSCHYIAKIISNIKKRAVKNSELQYSQILKDSNLATVATQLVYIRKSQRLIASHHWTTLIIFENLDIHVPPSVKWRGTRIEPWLNLTAWFQSKSLPTDKIFKRLPFSFRVTCPTLAPTPSRKKDYKPLTLTRMTIQWETPFTWCAQLLLFSWTS